tara:strand:+ start:32 stop:418 length:387 start_codon:yes stop_codon:yes gene_type:complete
MAYESISLGDTANDGQGDTLRDAGGKINGNFAQLFSSVAVSTITGNTTVTNSDGVFLVDASSVDVTLSIPSAGNNAGKLFTVKKISAAGSVNINTNSPDHIDGASTKVLTTQWDSVQFISDGANWFII